MLPACRESGDEVVQRGGQDDRAAAKAQEDQLIRWARFTMNPSGPRTDAMRQMSSY
jgi:hypothetical protein